jgi:diphthamide biosynthesis protein 4
MGDLPDDDPYLLLSTPPDADAATIRAAYTALVLTCHPDKVGGDDEAGAAAAAALFVRVQRAWEVLRDPSARAAYDAGRRERRAAAAARAAKLAVVAEEVPLAEMDAADGRGGERTYGCRCGDAFRLTAEDVADRVTVLDCPTCCLRIRVLYDGGE